mmetsp:Transcript_32625/g.62834  ORF Transcript_32625/g.62834 Transcript_32625/m.62834 type:complete len:325 (-) Transcript_32625:522-1496(-)
MSSPPEETPIGGDLVNDTLLSLLRQHVNDIRRYLLTMQSKFGNTFISCITQKPSNETLLSVAFISFMSFATIQFSVAFFAKSEAMIGDSAAMVVDALTYGLNLFAERRKNDPDDDIEECENSEVDHKFQQKSPNRTRSMNEGFERIKTNSEKELDMKRRNLKLEIVPPVISVSILIVVIGVVLQNAIRVLILDSHRNKKEQSLQFYEEALRVYEESDSADASDVANCQQTIGILQKGLGDFETALTCFGKALRGHRSAEGDKSLSVATDLYYMGMLYDSFGEAEKALQCFHECLKIRRKELEEDHLDVLAAKRFIANLERKMMY